MKYIDSYQIFESKHDVDIKDKLENGYCEFYYRKASGEKRHAYGTLKDVFLEKVWEPSEDDDSKEQTTGNIVYWDIEKNAFRQFSTDLFIGLETYVETLSEFLEKFPKLEKKVKKAKENLKEAEKKSEEAEETEEKNEDDKNKK